MTSDVRLLVLAGLAALVAAGPAGAATHPTCDRLPGRTLAANVDLRVYVAAANRKSGRETAIAVCATKTRKVTRLVSGKRSVKLAQVAINGSTAAAVDWAYSNMLGNNPGVSYTSVRAIDVTTRRTTVTTVLGGLVVEDIVVTTDGAIAMIGLPFAKALPNEGGADPETAKRSAASVFFADGRTNRTPKWSDLEDGPVGSLAGLAFSGSTLVWQRDGGLKSFSLQ